MDMGLIDLPQSKWGSGTGRQVILKGDFAKIEAAIIQSLGLLAPPTMVWVDATSIKVPVTADDIAAVMMCGFPSQTHRGLFISGGLSDGRYRENAAEVTLDFDLGADRWGSEKPSQWYAVFALAGNADTAFSLQAMPFMRVSSQASQVITLRNNLNSADIGYGFTTDSLVDGAIYVFGGASKGLLRPITANNNNDTTGGTITYGGDALTLAQGDWFVVLPPATNFRFLGSIFNNSSSNILAFIRKGNKIYWVNDHTYPEWNWQETLGLVERIPVCCPLATELTLKFTSYTGEVILGMAGISSDNYARAAQYPAFLTSPVELCKFYLQSGGDAYPHAISYAYPPNCGY